MAHKEWCGKSCCDCEYPCSLDAMLLCSPDCENLLESGEPDPVKCAGCDAYSEYMVMFGGDEE